MGNGPPALTVQQEFARWVASKFPGELADVMRSESNQRHGPGLYQVDQSVIRFLATVVPRTAFAPCVPVEHEPFEVWIQRSELPPLLRAYAWQLRADILEAPARREAERAAREAAKKEAVEVAAKDAATEAERLFAAREEREAAGRRENVDAQRRVAEEIIFDEGALVRRFLEVAYRKVCARDEYGEEQWHALERELLVVLRKFAKKYPAVRVRPDRKEAPPEPTLERSEQRRAAYFQTMFRHGLARRYSIQAAREHAYRETNKTFAALAGEWTTDIIHWRLREAFMQHYADRRASARGDEAVAAMTGPEFEAYLMTRLVTLGVKDVAGTPSSGDQGGDVLFSHFGVRVVVQCKRYVGSVGNKAVQEVHAAKGFYQSERSWVVTSSTFTSSARQLADTLDVTLIGGSELPRLKDYLDALGRRL